MEKCYLAYGTKIKNYETNEIGLLICSWINKFADGDVMYATCVDPKGKRYNTPMDNIVAIEEV